MCAYSLVADGWRHPTWPQPLLPVNPMPVSPNAIPWERIKADPDLAAQMLDVLAKLEAIDQQLDTMKNCKFAEPEKQLLKAALLRIANRLDDGYWWGKT